MKRAASWFLCLLCPLTTVDCSRAPTAPPALSSTLISCTSFEEDTVLGEKTTFDTWFQTLFLTPTPVVLGGHVFDYRAVSMLRQTTQRLNVCHNCFATYPHEQWVAFHWYVGLVWGQWASAVTTWSSVLEHLSCDKKKHLITDYFQDNYSCCLFLVALVCDARRRSRDQEKKKIKQIWEMFGSSAFLVVLLFGELTFAQASVSFCLLCTSNTVAP